MAWKNINDSLQNFKNRKSIKNGIQVSLMKKLLQKKFHIENIALEKDRLIIETKDSVLAQELNFEKEILKEELNKFLGEQKIKEIVIRVV